MPVTPNRYCIALLRPIQGWLSLKAVAKAAFARAPPPAAGRFIGCPKCGHDGNLNCVPAVWRAEFNPWQQVGRVTPCATLGCNQRHGVQGTATPYQWVWSKSDSGCRFRRFSSKTGSFCRFSGFLPIGRRCKTCFAACKTRYARCKRGFASEKMPFAADKSGSARCKLCFVGNITGFAAEKRCLASE